MMQPIKRIRTGDSSESFLDTQERDQDNRNRAKSSKPAFNIQDICQRIRDLYIQASRENNANGLEIEARIGLLDPNRNGFKSGVIIEDWAALLRRLSRKYGSAQGEIRETDYLYNDHRVTVNSDNQVIKKEAKTDKTSFDQQTNLIYDVRVSSAIERQLSPLPNSPPNGYESTRTKIRHSFVDPNNPHWRIDLTLVRSNQEETYEVELEIFNEFIIQALQKNTLPTLINNFIFHAKQLISTIQPGQLSFPDIHMTKVEIYDEAKVLKEIVFKYVPNSNPNRQEFPGAMPVNFGKKDFPTVQDNLYWVSEKTDGIRYMLLIYNNHTYLIDRKFDFFKVDGFENLSTVFGNGTLLDGEMIRHLDSGTPMYFIFDILAHKMVPCGTENFDKRLRQIGVVIGEYRAKERELGNSPFTIIAKHFFEARKVHQLFHTHIKEENGMRIFLDAKRKHQTDGLILTPNKQYVPYADQGLFKWKYLDKWTIDFKVACRENKWNLYCTGPSHTEIPCRQLQLSAEDFERLGLDWRRSRDTNAFIGEFSFDNTKGIWKYHQVRPDKKKANYIGVFVDTMESICEAITKDEICYRFQCPVDNWDQELDKIRNQMISSLNKKLREQQQQQQQQQQQHHPW